MLDPMGHERAQEYGGTRESKQETIQEHQEKIIAGHSNNDKADEKK